MASVLGTSRGSGGLNSQLKCKSKRRRRRRSKRKGKDLAFCAAYRELSAPLRRPLVWGVGLCPEASLWVRDMSAQSRALWSSDAFVNVWGFGGPEGTVHRAAAGQQCEEAGQQQAEERAGTGPRRPSAWRTAPSRTHSMAPALLLTLTEETLAHGAKGNIHLSQHPCKPGARPCASFSIQIALEKEAGSHLPKLPDSLYLAWCLLFCKHPDLQRVQACPGRISRN